ncbi:RNA polymerase sigma factor [Rubinisphaera sp.]|uniref:RNA polymerase sigma factor n=1 Tax=Rubinisphaera sp. TaxID=2024857 RepID=UPI000C10B271|nr:RNA polymerase sigma factor [Rubinisphaera sp.]MBV11314.1 hypothetical protein [Rubinisphaera sp.]HCS54440.1 hypothetical protein [Planctomycetaceae bacterium]|tara:strand:- start:21845 stop:22399 length:555 start_codon:yes stop_codon:yes gene_type:complete
MKEIEDDLPAEENPPLVDLASALYRLHAAGLRAYLIKNLRDPSLADDILQQTFSKLQEQICRKEADNQELTISAGWLYRVAFNEVARIKRNETRQKNHYTGLASFFSQLRGDHNDHLIQAEEAERVRNAFEHLPDSLKEIVELRIFEEMKFAEIAQVLQIPIGTVLTRMTRALKVLRQALQQFE